MTKKELEVIRKRYMEAQNVVKPFTHTIHHAGLDEEVTLEITQLSYGSLLAFSKKIPSLQNKISALSTEDGEDVLRTDEEIGQTYDELEEVMNTVVKKAVRIKVSDKDYIQFDEEFTPRGFFAPQQLFEVGNLVLTTFRRS